MIRIVKLSFKEEKTAEFIAYFDTIKTNVARYKNCNGMRLLQDKKNPNVVFTYSEWKSEEDLNHYRNSEMFNKTWQKIKPWFNKKAEAWSTDIYFNGFGLDL